MRTVPAATPVIAPVVLTTVAVALDADDQTPPEVTFVIVIVDAWQTTESPCILAGLTTTLVVAESNRPLVEQPILKR